MKAVRLFGGKQVLNRRINDVARRSLSQIDDKKIAALEEAFRLRSGTIRKIRENKSKVNIRLFDKLSVPLRITYSEAFGSPKWENTQIKEKWQQHKETNWINGGVSSTLGTNLDVPLDFYVTLIAASELRNK